MFQHLQINQCDTPHNKMDKPYVIISIDAEKDSDKIKHLALIKKKKKTRNKLSIEAAYLNITKTINMISPQLVSRSMVKG